MGTIRREYLDHTLFWTTADLENKLLNFRTYFNNHTPRIPHWKDERPIGPCHNQSQISARFDSNHTVEPYIRHPGWLICQRLALAALFGQPRKNFQRNHSVFSSPARFADAIVSLPPYQFTRDTWGLVTKDDDAGVHKGTRNRLRGL